MLNICARLLLVAFTAFVAITGCVPKKKFLASQASLGKVRTDSTSLAEKVASLQADVQTLTQWNSSLQQQYDKPFEAAISDIADVQGNVMGTQVQIKIFIGNKQL